MFMLLSHICLWRTWQEACHGYAGDVKHGHAVGCSYVSVMVVHL
jgi:hypothetical protein